MDKLLKFKAGEVLRNNHKFGSALCEVFVLTISFPFITGLNEAEESRNEDLDFKKNKWKFIKSQIVLLPVMLEALREECFIQTCYKWKTYS